MVVCIWLWHFKWRLGNGELWIDFDDQIMMLKSFYCILLERGVYIRLMDRNISHERLHR